MGREEKPSESDEARHDLKKEYDLKKLKKRTRRPPVDPEANRVAISLRLPAADLVQLKEEAERTGIPYQTLLSSILHRYLTGELIETKTVRMLKKLMAG